MTDFQAALTRAIHRGHPEDLRRQCDPCQAACLQCCAITRVAVHFWAAEPPLPSGSSYSTQQNWPEIDRELEAIGGVGASCESCRPVREATMCRCGGGVCNVPTAAGTYV
jgi:hypothetical protein